MAVHVAGRCRCAARQGLTLIATDGETFGHHQRDGVQLLADMLRDEPASPYEMVTLTDYLRTHPPTHRG